MNSKTMTLIAILHVVGIIIAGATLSSSAQVQPASTVLGEVLVTGEQPGPALWQVKNGENVLWILGEVSPLPARVTWRSKQFEAVLAESQEVILDGRLALPPRSKAQEAATKRASELPHGTTLKDVVSAETYTRFEEVRNSFAKSNHKIDRLRPFDAMRILNNNALKSLRVAGFGASIAVPKLAENAKAKVTRLEHTYEDHGEFLRTIETNSTEPCFEYLSGLENNGAGIKALANAWSVGDIDELRRLIPLYAMGNRTHGPGACSVALHDSEESANDVIAEHMATWLAAAEKALTTNRSTISVVQMVELFAADGYLASLRLRGYEVIEPK